MRSFHAISYQPTAACAYASAILQKPARGCPCELSRGCVRSCRLLSGVGVVPRASLAARAENSHNGYMSKPRVEFKYKRIAENEWQIEAHYPGAELRYIKGFKSKAEVDEWLQGSRRIDWLRSQGYAK
jgi:hypothetical protein